MYEVYPSCTATSPSNVEMYNKGRVDVDPGIGFVTKSGSNLLNHDADTDPGLTLTTSPTLNILLKPSWLR